MRVVQDGIVVVILVLDGGWKADVRSMEVLQVPFSARYAICSRSGGDFKAGAMHQTSKIHVSFFNCRNQPSSASTSMGC